MCVYSLVVHGDVRPRTTIVGKVFVVKALLIIGRVLSLKLRSNGLLVVGGWPRFPTFVSSLKLPSVAKFETQPSGNFAIFHLKNLILNEIFSKIKIKRSCCFLQKTQLFVMKVRANDAWLNIRPFMVLRGPCQAHSNKVSSLALCFPGTRWPTDHLALVYKPM